MSDPNCVHCGEPIRYQMASAKYRHVRNDRHGPTRCRDRQTHAAASTEDHMEDCLIALDGGQLSLGVDDA